MAVEHPIIHHHFAQSPFSEKIWLIFGRKKIAWTAVAVTRITPRPDLMPA
jgi:glutathione S-transferase